MKKIKKTIISVVVLISVMGCTAQSREINQNNANLEVSKELKELKEELKIKIYNEDESIYEKRRKALSDKLKEKEAIIIFSGEEKVRTNDLFYAFEPNRDFYYLLGLEIPESAFVMYKNEGKVYEIIFTYENIGDGLFVEKRKKPSEISDETKVPNLMKLNQLESTIKGLLNKGKIEELTLNVEDLKIKYGNWEESDGVEKDFVRDLKLDEANIKFNNISIYMNDLRGIKSQEEVENIKKAIEITKIGIYEMMKNSKEATGEYDLEADFMKMLIKNKSKKLGFDSIIASGKNALVLHYMKNDSNFETKQDLVLVDVGASYKNYSADISRTFPVSGKFTEKQKKFYSAVLEVQKEIIEMAKPGVTFKELNRMTTNKIAQKLMELDIIKEKNEVYKYYYHGVTHHLGLDAHDRGFYGELKEGMVITIEPGIYIAEENIGIRIEDDILITEEGNEVLSKDIIKEIDDIENYMK